MALSHKSRRRWSLVLLLLGLPLHIFLAMTVVGWFDRPGFLVELAIYIGLGVFWVVPFRFVFRGIGQPDPDGKGPE